MRTAAAALLVLVALSACERAADRSADARAFPSAERPVSKPAGSGFTTEDQRDDLGEAETVMDLAQIVPGMTVADIGAGEGYYTVRLAERVGRKGRVLAQDIDGPVLARLGNRVERERLDNVSIKLGKPNDPMLPAGSFDRIFMVHMYHEVGEPYAFLWRLRPTLKPGGQVIVVDTDRPSSNHGMPPEQLFCEFQAVGFRLAEFVRKPELRGYFARFEAVGDAPAPAAIVPCKGDGKTVT